MKIDLLGEKPRVDVTSLLSDWVGDNERWKSCGDISRKISETERVEREEFWEKF